MSVETDTDRTALLADFAVTVVRILDGTFQAVVSEDDGLTLDGGTSIDGITQLLAVTADLDAISLAERDQVSIGAQTYYVDKRDDLADGLSVLHLGIV